jgi:hypothetical protein
MMPSTSAMINMPRKNMPVLLPPGSPEHCSTLVQFCTRKPMSTHSCCAANEREKKKSKRNTKIHRSIRNPQLCLGTQNKRFRYGFVALAPGAAGDAVALLARVHVAAHLEALLLLAGLRDRFVLKHALLHVAAPHTASALLEIARVARAKLVAANKIR